MFYRKEKCILILDYYQEFLSKRKIILKEVSSLEKESDVYITNKYIYLNSINNFIVITSWQDDKYEYFMYGSSPNITTSEYFIFYTNINLLNQNYTLLITNNNVQIFLYVYIYNSDLVFDFNHIMDYEYNLINWLNIDELTNKVEKASRYIFFMLSTVDNEPIIKNHWMNDFNKLQITDFNLNISTKLKSVINYYLCLQNDINNITNTHDTIYIYNNDVLKPLMYINYNDQQCIIDKKPIGELKDVLFYFFIDKDRSILIKDYPPFNHKIFLFFQGNNLIDSAIYKFVNQIEGLFTLINRKDIYRFLKKVHLFKDNIWKKYAMPSMYFK